MEQMEYKLDIKYTSKPTWITMVIGRAKAYLDRSETFDGVTSIIGSCLDDAIIVTRNTRTSGRDIKREFCYDSYTMVIYNQNRSILCTIKYIKL